MPLLTLPIFQRWLRRINPVPVVVGLIDAAARAFDVDAAPVLCGLVDGDTTSDEAMAIPCELGLVDAGGFSCDVDGSAVLLGVIQVHKK